MSELRWRFYYTDPETGMEYSSPCSDEFRNQCLLTGRCAVSDFTVEPLTLRILTGTERARLLESLRPAPSARLKAWVRF